MVGVIPVGHRLATRKVQKPEDIEVESFISMAPLMETRMKIDSLMLSYGVNRRINVETQISSVVIRLVEAGAGISIIDPLTATGYTGDQVRFIPFKPDIVTDYSMVISPRNSSTLVLKPFIDHARREIRKMVPTHLIVRG